MDSIRLDLRFAWRMLRRKPTFTIVAVAALALGIGANTAIFSVIHGVLLLPLPYPSPERIAMVWLDNTRIGVREDITSWPNYRDWREQNSTFESMAGYSRWNPTLTGTGEPEQLRGATATATFFSVFGVQPARGRLFTAEEEVEGRDRVVILSQGLWTRRFGGDPDILGKSCLLNGQTYEVIGVMPGSFQFPQDAQLWAPLAPNERLSEARNAFWLPVVGRLKAGVSRDQAQAEMSKISADIARQFPEQEGYGVNIVLLHEQITGSIRPALLVLLGAVALVLLIACANVANLLLARAAEREREIAIRSALGARRLRIIGQVLCESLLLAALGGVLGLLLAFCGVRFLLMLEPADIPRLQEIGFSVPVLAYSLLICAVTGVLFGLFPALRTSRPDLNETLKDGGRGIGAGVHGRRSQQALVIAEVALALILLVGAGLLIRSFDRLQKVDPGFNPHGVLTLTLSPPRTRYAEAAQVSEFYRQLEERLSALPGVRSVGSTTGILLEKLPNSGTFTVEGRPPERRAERQELPFDSVTPGYFRTMGIPLVKGRFLTERDTPDQPRVAIINETTARLYWGNADPIGRRFKFGNPEDESPWITVVGVVQDTRRQGLDAPIRIESYFAHRQRPSRTMEVVLRVDGDPLALAGAAREVVRSIDGEIPVIEMRTLQQIVERTLAQRRLNTLLITLFASIALTLAVMGIYGVTAYAVTQRTHELGLRMALGANRTDLLRLVLVEGMKLSMIGVAIGLVGAAMLTRFMAGLLFGVDATDPVTFTAIALVLVLSSLAACYVPARRATRVDPMAALRCE